MELKTNQIMVIDLAAEAIAEALDPDQPPVREVDAYLLSLGLLKYIEFIKAEEEVNEQKRLGILSPRNVSEAS